MPSSYQVVLWKQESFVVLRPLQVEFFRNLLDGDLPRRAFLIISALFWIELMRRASGERGNLLPCDGLRDAQKRLTSGRGHDGRLRW